MWEESDNNNDDDANCGTMSANNLKMGSGQGCKEEVPQMEGRRIDNYLFTFADDSKDDDLDAA